MKAQRIKIMITPKTERTVIPWDYKRIISASIWASLLSEAKGDVKRGLLTLHNDPNIPSAFTFSNIFFRESKTSEHGIITEDTLTFYFTTPIKEIMELFLQALDKGNFHPNFVNIATIETKVQNIHVKKRMKMKTLSEILVRAKTDVGRRDIFPTNPLFYKLINSNLARKYTLITGKKPESRLKIEVDWFKPKFYDYGEFGKYHVSNMEFTVMGKRELIAVALLSGLGHRNAIGFGMIAPAH